MKRRDLRSRIIPTTIDNTNEFQNTGNKRFNTTDLIYLDSYSEQYDGKKIRKERRITATDYAQMNNAYIYDNYTTCTGRQATWALLRSASSRTSVDSINGSGDCINISTNNESAGLCPSLHYHLPSSITARSGVQVLEGQDSKDESEDLEQLNIREIKDLDRNNYISYITNW